MVSFLLSASEHGAPVDLPLWTIIPFVGLLLTIGVLSFITASSPHSKLAHFWENNNNKLILALLWAVPALICIGLFRAWEPLIESLEEYFSFIVLLFALFVIAGGIYLEGDLEATPKINTSFLAIGAVLANLVGTTGASMLLIRPVLKTNSERYNTAHIPVFFIFIVSNIGGSLLPIGDPPLFLGYLQGVPFFWTLHLVAPWVFSISVLLIIFYIWDTRAYKRETESALREDTTEYVPLRLRGSINFLWLAGVLAAVIFITPALLEEWGLSEGPLMFIREYLMLLMVGVSLFTSPLSSYMRKKNNFTFAPILEVAYLFIGIFIAVVPALQILKTHGQALGVTEPWQFFWATGLLSSVLDNAPTYLTFLSLAEGLAAQDPGTYAYLIPLQSGAEVPQILLSAISLGAVFMGAMTYIGNGPNFMVKAIADEWGYKMPDFLSYILRYSLPLLLPIFIAVTLLSLLVGKF
jgi:Na+/H+ antiporter NhaD/arsenite permease-like protein